MDLYHLLLVFFVLVLMLVGLAGTILPVLPGLAVVWLGALIYGLAWGFGRWGPGLFAVITILMLFGYGLNLLLTHLGALQTGASWKALLASLVLGTIGFFVVPVIGALIGAVLGLFLTEYYQRRDARQAWQAVKGAVVGFGLGFGLQIAVGLTMIGLWFVWVVAG